MPLYVRAGTIVPMQPLVQYTDEKPNGPLELHVYLPTSAPGNDCRGTLYQDDGHTFAYQKGEILRVNYSCQVSSGSVTVSSTIEKNAFQQCGGARRLQCSAWQAHPKKFASVMTLSANGGTTTALMPSR